MLSKASSSLRSITLIPGGKKNHFLSGLLNSSSADDSNNDPLTSSERTDIPFHPKEPDMGIFGGQQRYVESSLPLYGHGPDILWDTFHRLENGHVYHKGTVRHLQDMTSWKGKQVLYFGNHSYSDVADASLIHVLRTRAIMEELIPDFKWRVNWIQILQQLIKKDQEAENEVSRRIMNDWIDEGGETCFQLSVWKPLP